MSNPSKYGLLKESKVDPEFSSNLHSVLKLFQAIFYQTKSKESAYINELITKKKLFY